MRGKCFLYVGIISVGAETAIGIATLAGTGYGKWEREVQETLFI
jgi:hypothetical protein